MLHFTNNKELQNILKFQVTKPRSLPYGEGPTDEIGFVLVKDHGIYLMSPTDETMPSGNKETVSFVSYARGYKPTEENRNTLWERTHDISPDDFAMFIDLTPSMIKAIMHDNAILEVELMGDGVRYRTTYWEHTFRTEERVTSH